jgi:hypothetical protein
MKKKESLKILLLCILASIILHLLVAYKYRSPQVDPPQNAEQKSRDKKQSDSLDDSKISIWVGLGPVPCDSYEGIGVQFNSLTGIVSHVAPGAPAYNAGIRIGDELVTPLWNMKLIFGQVLTIVVLRNSKDLTFKVVVDRICHQ